LSKAIIETLWVGTDRKLQVALIGGRVLAGLQNGAVVHARIKSSAELVKHFTKLEWKTGEPIRLDWRKEYFPCPVTSDFDSMSVGSTRIKSIPEFCHGFCVQFRPVDTLSSRAEL
jgi:hypothetical protein